MDVMGTPFILGLVKEARLVHDVRNCTDFKIHEINVFKQI